MTMKYIRQPHAGSRWGKFGYVELDDGTRLDVVTEDDTEAPIRARDGSRIYWSTVRTLLLDNDSSDSDVDMVYACADCFYTADRPSSVMPHRNAHRDRENPKRPANKAKGSQNAPAVAVGESSLKRDTTIYDDEPETVFDTADTEFLVTALKNVINKAERVDLIESRVVIAEQNAERWKKRAETAEHDLDVLKKAFGKVSK